MSSCKNKACVNIGRISLTGGLETGGRFRTEEGEARGAEGDGRLLLPDTRGRYGVLSELRLPAAESGPRRHCMGHRRCRDCRSDHVHVRLLGENSPMKTVEHSM